MKINHRLLRLLEMRLEDLTKDELYITYFKNQDIEQIVNAYYLTNAQKGIGLVFNENKILTSIHLYNGETSGYNMYAEALPYNISFADNADIAQEKVGISEFESGGGEVLPILGTSNLWRKYYYDNCYLHLEFGSNDSIALITLGLDID